MEMKKVLKLAKLLVKLAEYEVPEGKKMVTVGDLAVGVEVLDEDGEKYPDGEYVVDGQKVKIVDGKVDELEALEPEDKPAPEQPAEEEAKPAEDMAKKCGLEDEVPAEEEKPAEPDEKDLRIAELEGLLADRDAVIEELTAKVKELEDKVAKPVEEPVQMNKVESTDNVKKGALKYFD